MNCPCCSGLLYSACCEPYHTKASIAPTAVTLMRSRYCAYALPNGQYLMETTYPAKRYQHDGQDMQNWGAQNSWIRLEIVAQPAIDKVEFKAYYTDKNGHKQLHHELSTFKKQNGKWYYFSSKFIHI